MEANVNADKIEMYLRGKLDSKETLEFEKELSQNSNLKSELFFQKSINEGIVNARKLALKTRLNNLSVSLSNPSGSVASFAPFKAAAIILASTGIGLAGYLYFNNSNNLAATSVSNEKIETVSDANKVEFKDEKQLVYNSTNTIVEDSKSENKEAISPSLKVEIKASKNEKKIKSKSTKQVPNMESFVDDSQSEVSSHTETPTSVNSSEEKLTKSDVDIKNIKDPAYKFHYKLENNVLYLYGNFDDARYEILEFNRKDDQVVYLFYKDRYFGMENNTSSITKLKPLKDSKLIENLEKLRVR